MRQYFVFYRSLGCDNTARNSAPCIKVLHCMVGFVSYSVPNPNIITCGSLCRCASRAELQSSVFREAWTNRL
ncbi:hypothetical protein P879_09339 [Paragonimus westermani]|uniref:Uncharacterized protein n=1 Tax=Paragonimus westermani TaxID=34504 RepID=A0A8T0DHU3_9TREM|nr:hypothetical protein P879_09339 [Paragonimus westermani]